jgi:hypothetical protein
MSSLITRPVQSVKKKLSPPVIVTPEQNDKTYLRFVYPPRVVPSLRQVEEACSSFACRGRVGRCTWSTDLVKPSPREVSDDLQQPKDVEGQSQHGRGTRDLLGHVVTLNRCRKRSLYPR